MNRFNKTIGWLALIPNPIIQTNEAWFLTNTEKIHALFLKICEVIDTVNSTNDLLRKLKDILDDFDDTVKDEVEKYIKKLYETGELATMIGKIIAENIVPSNVVIDPTHIGRVLHYSHYWEASGYGDNTFDYERYSYAQGNCCFNATNGNKYWVVSYVCQNGSHFNYNNSATLYVYKVNSDNTMEYKSRVTVPAVGHCNGLCYHKGYIYITPNSYQVQQPNGNYVGQLTTDVIRFKFDETTETINGASESKTPTVSQSNGWSDCISSCDGKLYFTDGELNIYEYDWDNNNAVLIHSHICYPYVTRPQNGMAVSSNYIYVLGRDQRMYRYNRVLEVTDMCYQIPSICNDGMFKTGEIEGISLIGNTMYFGSCYNLGLNPYINSCAVTRFLCQDIVTNGIPATQPPTTTINWTSSITNNVSLYVAGDIPSDTDNPKNPFGLTMADGFNCVQDALDFIESNKWIKRVNLVVYQRVNQTTIDIKTDKPITISGSLWYHGNSTYEAHDTKPLIGRITCLSTNCLFITEVGIRNLVADDVISHIGVTEGNNSCVYLYRSTATLSKIYCPVGTNSNPSYVKYMINAPLSFINFSYGDSDQQCTTQEQWLTRSGSPVYLYVDGGTANAHNRATKNSNIIG